MGLADEAKKKLSEAVGGNADQDSTASSGGSGETSRPTGPTGPSDPGEPTKSTEPAAPSGPMGSGVPGGGADRSDDPISKAEDDGDGDPVPTDPSPVPPEPGAQPNENQPNEDRQERGGMHNMRSLDDE